MNDVKKALEMKEQLQEFKNSVIRIAERMKTTQDKVDEMIATIKDLGYEPDVLDSNLEEMEQTMAVLSQNIENNMGDMQSVIDSVKGV